MSDADPPDGLDPKAACDRLTAIWIASFQAWSTTVATAVDGLDSVWEALTEPGAPKPDA